LNRAHPLIVLIIVLTSLLLASTPPPARATAQPPFSTISIGDWWKYSLTVRSVGATLTLTETIVGSATQVVNNVATDCYKVTLTGTGTFSFMGLSGSLTESGMSYFRKTDMALVNTNLTQVLTAGFVLTQIIYTNTSVPVLSYQFPLYVGQTWSENYNSTTTTTSYTSINPTPSTTKNTTLTSENFNVASESVLSVPAGSFDAYDVHSADTSGSYTDDFYSPQVENGISTVSHLPNGTIDTSLSLEDFSAWPFQSSMTVSKSGTSYSIGLYADATISNQQQNSTAITFQVNATSGTTGRANIAIPRTLNNTLVKIYVDNNLQTPTVTSNSTSYIFYFTFGLTTHTVTLVYASSPTTPLTTYLLYGVIAAAIAIVIIVALLLTRRRAKPAPAIPMQTTAPPLPPTTPPGPSGDQPTSSP
jgi:hypothetical protein